MSVLLIDLTGNYFIDKNDFFSLTLSILIYQTSTPCLIVAERKIISYWRKLLLQISTNLYSLVSVRHHRDQEVDEDDRGDQQVEDEDKLRWEQYKVKIFPTKTIITWKYLMLSGFSGVSITSLSLLNPNKAKKSLTMMK